MPTNEALIPLADAPAPDPREIETEESRRKRFRQQLERAQRGGQHRLKEFLLALKRDFRQVDREARDSRLRETEQMLRYYDGDMYLEFDEAGKLVDVRRDCDFAYSIPVMTGHVLEVFKQLLKVEAEWVFSARDENDETVRRLAAMCEKIANEEFERMMGEEEEQYEILTFILTGDSYREIYWGESSRKARRLDYSREEVELPGRLECQACGRITADGGTAPAQSYEADGGGTPAPETAQGAGATACPSCGADFLKQIPAEKTHRDLPPEEVEVRLGENRLRVPHPMAVQTDLSAVRFDDTTFLIEHTTLERHVAAWAYQTLIHDNEGYSPEMAARRNLERSGVQMDGLVGSTRPWASAPAGNGVEIERHFLDAARYGHFLCGVDEPLPDGSRIPAGTILGDHFPDGIFVEYAGDVIVDVRPVERRRRWLKITYGLRVGSSAGQGAKLLAMMNDIINDRYNLYHGVVMTSARPYTVVAPNVKLLPEVGQYMRMENWPAGLSDIRAAIAQFGGQSVAGMDPASQDIQAAMQFTMGSFTLGPGGAPDMQRAGKTATEFSGRVEQASDRQLGPIRQRLAADRETRFIILENVRDFAAPEQKKEYAKRFGEDVCAVFFGPEKGEGANFRHLLNLNFKPNTDIPRSRALTQMGMQAFASAAAGLMKVAQGQPWVMEFLGQMADAWGLPLELGPGRKDRREAEKRLNKLGAIEEEIGRRRPEVLADQAGAAKVMYEALAEFFRPLVPPVPLAPDQPGQAPEQAARLFMQEHQAFMEAYSEEYFSERAANYSPARKTVIVWLWLEHFRASLGKQFHQAEMMQEIQQTLNPQPDPNQQDKRALVGAAIRHQAEEESKDADARRTLAVKEHEHALDERAKDNDARREAALDENRARTQIAVNDEKARSAKRYSAFKEHGIE
jgi:hypothetical protein